MTTKQIDTDIPFGSLFACPNTYLTEHYVVQEKILFIGEKHSLGDVYAHMETQCKQRDIMS